MNKNKLLLAACDGCGPLAKSGFVSDLTAMSSGPVISDPPRKRYLTPGYENLSSTGWYGSQAS
jgi:hypothetical protein